MELEELKAEAMKLGYNLVPRREYVKKQPCICGRKTLGCWHYYDKGIHMMYVKCPKCGREGPGGESENEAKKYWNVMIENLKEQQS